jgi:hypothetical protein
MDPRSSAPMTLSHVEYEFHEFEEPADNAVELHRQVRLRFADAPVLFVSWTWERYQGTDTQPYSVGYRESSYFSENAAHVVDASSTPVWSKHIGKTVELVYKSSSSPQLEFQILEVRSGHASTFLSSLGTDTIRISDTVPVA